LEACQKTILLWLQKLTIYNANLKGKIMSIKKVWLDESEDECTSCNLCEDTAPEVFEVPDKMVVKKDADLEKYDAEIREAVEGCPTQVIKMEED
jgi:ferredoxin